MLDFLIISHRMAKDKKKGSESIEVYPKFVIKKSKDLMIRGGDFYAIWVEDKKTWSTDEQDALRLIDVEIQKKTDELQDKYPDTTIKSMFMWDADSGMIDKWHKYCQKQSRDNYHNLDEHLIFSNMDSVKENYATKKLSYPLEEGTTEAYDRLMSVLYSPEERAKIEWAIGSIVSGDSKHIQKFIVLYGSAGTGKSTVLNIIQQLFEGYYSVFDAKALGTASNAFALEAFKDNPLVAIQHDGDLSRIEDNTRLNSLVSHEEMRVNEKFKSTYTSRFKAFLFMGTNEPVKITNAKSGLIRRLIDVTPTGDKLSSKEYKTIMKRIPFELGGIATHCLEFYKSDPNRYDDYIPIAMLGASNDFYNFVLDSYSVFVSEDGVSLKAAWEMYKTYCDESNVAYPMSKRKFKEELKNYFREYSDRVSLDDGSRIRSYFTDFRKEIFHVGEDDSGTCNGAEKDSPRIEFDEQVSQFDIECNTFVAQYAKPDGTPKRPWSKTDTTLADIDTHMLHYVRLPENHIVIDFDIPGPDGEKDYEKNLKEASKWPPTYAELSKSGKGIHLHYIYTGDPKKLSRIYDDHIEIKVFTGKSSLRRKLTKCNNLPISTISSGLPLKGEDKMVNFEAVKSEKTLRMRIKKNLNKEYHPNTKPSIDFIYKILEDAYNSGLNYDVSDMRNAVLALAASSTHQADTCIKIVNKMKFKSNDASEVVHNVEQPIIFYDVEVFPNLFLVNWKIQGEGKPVVRMINPKPKEIEELLKFRLVGFNCRRYDNHMLYACLMGYTNEQLYELSNKIVNSPKGTNVALFSEAYNISYTDVYDFCVKKQSLKKWEIELGIHHHELGLPWDQPVPEDRWEEVAAYCDDDVLATEAVFDARKADFIARQIQVDLVKKLHGISNVSVNDTTNSLSTKILFGNNRKPQDQFNYRDLSKPVGSDQYQEYRKKFGDDYRFRVFNSDGLPEYRDYIPGEKLKDGWSILPFFPGYKYELGKSTYLNEEIGEGGRVYSEPGMYEDVWDGDVASMHPHSVIFEVLFGPKFTRIFEDIVRARVAIKHRDFDTASTLLDGCLKPYLNEDQADDLAQALKIVVNSIYGLTSAKYDNPFRDIRNKDNIVAKRGALFMTLLKREVQKLGYQVCHIKTDSIKIPNATQEIQEFVINFGKEYGYAFETEADFDRYCLVNDAVYIARHKTGKKAGKWTATGAQFAVPYVFKTLFSKEPIEFEDLCETRSVKTSLYLDMNEKLVLNEDAEKELNARIKLLGNDVEAVENESGFITAVDPAFMNTTTRELKDAVNKGHNYVFVGRIGQFCPIKPGCGGGLLMREQNGKFYAAGGTKGYRWLESEVVKELGKENDIDKRYYQKLVDDAVDTISNYGDFEAFVA